MPPTWFFAMMALVVAAFAALAISTRRMEEHGPVAVVDRRTLRIALRRIDGMVEIGDRAGAHFAATAAQLWLRDQIRAGRGGPQDAMTIDRLDMLAPAPTPGRNDHE